LMYKPAKTKPIRAACRTLLLFFALLCASSSALAQNITTVTGTVADPNGLPYSNGSIQVQLIPIGTTPSIPPPCNGQSANPCQVATFYSGTLDVNGSFTMNLASNAALTPGGTQWQFTVNQTPGVPPPIGFGPQSFSIPITISGATQNVSATLSAVAPMLARVNSSSGGPAPSVIKSTIAGSCPPPIAGQDSILVGCPGGPQFSIFGSAYVLFAGPSVSVPVAFSTTPVFQYTANSLETSFYITLTANVTSSTLLGGVIQSDACFYITNTASFSFVWPPNLVGPPQLNANGLTSACFTNFDGTNWNNNDLTPNTAAGNAILASPTVGQTVQPTQDVLGFTAKCFNGTNTADCFGVQTKTGVKTIGVDASANVNLSNVPNTGVPVLADYAGIATPGAPTIATTAATGLMAAGTYLVSATCVNYINNTLGETLNSADATGLAVVANGKLTVTGLSAGTCGTGNFYNVYMSPAGGTWQAAFNYRLNSVVVDPTNHTQKVTTAGLSQTPGPPTWNDAGGTTTDGTVTWTDQGIAATSNETLQNRVPIPVGTNYVQYSPTIQGTARPAANTTIGSNSAGCGAGTYWEKITTLDSFGHETQAIESASAVTITAGHSIKITFSPVVGGYTYRAYRTPTNGAAGSETGYVLIPVGAGVASFYDSCAALTTRTPPGTNTTVQDRVDTAGNISVTNMVGTGPDPWVDVRDFCANPLTCSTDGSDETNAIQQAMDYAVSLSQSDTYSQFVLPICWLGPSRWHITRTLQWHGCSLQGVQAANGTSIVWDGPTGGTAILNDPAAIGGTANRKINDLTIFSGVNLAGTFINYAGVGPGQTADIGTVISRIGLGLANGGTTDSGGGSGNCIEVPDGWVNLHFDRIFFQNCAGYAIHLVPVSQPDETFSLENSTEATNTCNGAASSKCAGFVQIDQSNGTGASGVYEFRNIRVETDAAGFGGNSALFDLVYPAGSPSYWCSITLQDFTFQNSAAGAYTMFYADGPDGTKVPCRIETHNVQASAASSTVLGPSTFWNGLTIASPSAGQLMNFVLAGDAGNTLLSIGGEPYQVNQTAAANKSFGTQVVGDTNDRYACTAAGTCTWGPGSGAADTTLKRLGAGVLQTTFDFASNHFITSGSAPTCVATGGTTPTCTVQGGSTDSGGIMQIQQATGSASGTVQIVFATALGDGAHSASCVAVPNSATGTWNARASLIVAGAPASGASLTFNWDNNAVALTNATNYLVDYFCTGRR
jgi:hypothetical protein